MIGNRCTIIINEQQIRIYLLNHNIPHSTSNPQPIGKFEPGTSKYKLPLQTSELSQTPYTCVCVSVLEFNPAWSSFTSLTQVKLSFPPQNTVYWFTNLDTHKELYLEWYVLVKCYQNANN